MAGGAVADAERQRVAVAPPVVHGEKGLCGGCIVKLHGAVPAGFQPVAEVVGVVACPGDSGRVGGAVVIRPELKVAAGQAAAVDDAVDVGFDVEVCDRPLEGRAGRQCRHGDLGAVGRESVHRRPKVLGGAIHLDQFNVVGDTVERIDHRCRQRAVDAVRVGRGVEVAGDRNVERVDAFVAAGKLAGVSADMGDDLCGQGGASNRQRGAGGHRVGIG